MSTGAIPQRQYMPEPPIRRPGVSSDPTAANTPRISVDGRAVVIRRAHRPISARRDAPAVTPVGDEAVKPLLTLWLTAEPCRESRFPRPAARQETDFGVHRALLLAP